MPLSEVDDWQPVENELQQVDHAQMSDKKHVLIASDKDFEDLMAYVQSKQESESGQFQTVSTADGFSTVHAQMVKYDATKFLEKADRYLNDQPMDLVQAGEKLWGAVIFALKKAYLAIEVDVLSHAANCALFKAASKVFDNDTTADLRDAWSIVEKCHDNFYEHLLPKSDVSEGLEGAKLVVQKLESIDLECLRQIFDVLRRSLRAFLNLNPKNVTSRMSRSMEELSIVSNTSAIRKISVSTLMT
uniref:Uncharacterized protein n=1 Tax=Ditylenchus dipsaci TaxID=166011 RepID=A0A915E4N6_9BILA